jgi:hypothetical protein
MYGSPKSVADFNMVHVLGNEKDKMPCDTDGSQFNHRFITENFQNDTPVPNRFTGSGKYYGARASCSISSSFDNQILW